MMNQTTNFYLIRRLPLEIVAHEDMTSYATSEEIELLRLYLLSMRTHCRGIKTGPNQTKLMKEALLNID